MASFTLGNAQLANHKTAPAVGRMQLPQVKANSSVTFGPKLGCRTQAFNVRRSGAMSASRQQPLVVAMAAGKGYKVALLGAAGGIGQPLGLLLKMNKYISELSLYDLAPFTPGVAKDLSHCNTPSKAEGFVGEENLGKALQGADLVVIPAGVPRKPGMTRDDLFNINAGIVKTLTKAIAQHAPNAIINIISNPVNSTVPIAAEVLKAAGVYDKRKLLGVSTLDVVRANTFVAESKGLDVRQVDVPVIGGHAGATILPLLSQATPAVSFDDAEIEPLTKRIQEAGTEVVEAKAGAGSATLSMAYAAARMAESVLMGLDGTTTTECAYVESDVVPGVDFFAHKLKLGKNGIEEYLPLGELSAYEQKALEEAVTILQGNIKKGKEFAAQD
jgi:malate dehydrogenase